MDKKYSPPNPQGKQFISIKTMVPKKQIPSRENEGIFSSSIQKKYVPDEQSSKLILSYFEFNNFQDFNTWQQIARTKTEYTFEETVGDRFDCQLVFKWEAGDKDPIVLKTKARTKKHAKKRALILLIETLMYKGLIGHGFKQKNFVDKLPRRKKYESSSSQEDDNNEVHHTRKVNVLNSIRENNNQTLLNSLCLENAVEIWGYALHKRDLGFCQKVLFKTFSKEENKIDEQLKVVEFCEMSKKQVSYVEQFKDPFQEDLTVFIRFQQLQRPQYSKRNFNLYPVNEEKSIKMTLPSFLLENTEKGTMNIKNKLDSFRDFRTIDQASQMMGRGEKKIKKSVRMPFFDELKNISLPKFQEDMQTEHYYSLKLIERMFNQILYVSDDYNYALNALQLLEKSLNEIQFLNLLLKNDKKQDQKKLKQQAQLINLKAQTYYKDMKKKLLTELLFNVNTKVSSQRLSKSLSIEGMLSYASAHSKYEGIFQFISKEPQDITGKKIQRKSNFNEFFEQHEFCTDQVILLVNKLTQSTYIGIIRQLTQTFKIQVPHLLFQSECDFPVPFTLYKLLNNKIYNRISSALVHTCKNYMEYVDYDIGKNKNVCLVHETPSGPHIQVIEEILAECVAKKLFVLIVSENYEMLHKLLADKGFKCLKIMINSDEKIVSKNNIILASPLNVCCDFMKNIAFDRVIIDQAQRIPEIISLLSIIKCIKKVYLIGDPNLPRSEMKSSLSKLNGMQKSLFEKFWEKDSSHLTFTNSGFTMNENLQKNTENRIFDSSIVEWMKQSVYGESILTELEETTKKKTPLIKGFNWPSNDYRLCFINVKNKYTTKNEWVNSQCSLITWIIAEVLRSGFTELEQISCCTMDVQFMPVLQQHLLKILQRLNIQRLQWPMVFQSLIKSLNGSRWSSNDLLIVLVNDSGRKSKNKQESEGETSQFEDEVEMGKKLNSALLQAERGLIIVGDLDELGRESSAWSNFLDWMAMKKLILCYEYPQ